MYQVSVRVRHYDSGKVTEARLDSKGMLEVPAAVTRVGILLYRNADGTIRRELRHPDDVFDAKSLATMRGASVTVGHTTPTVTSGNSRDHEVGLATSEGRRADDGVHVETDFYIRRQDAISRIPVKHKPVPRDALVEVSSGYDLDLEPNLDGSTYEGQGYDFRQRNIVYNHFALLPAGAGRAGRGAALRLDADDAVEVGGVDDNFGAPRLDSDANRPKEKRMSKINLDGVEYDCPEQTAQVIHKMVADHERTKGELAAATKRADSLDGELSQAKKELESANDPTRLDSLVQRISDVRAAATEILGKSADLKGLSVRQVQEKALKHLDSAETFDGKSDDYVDGVFKGAVASRSRTNADRGGLVPQPKQTEGGARADANDAPQTWDQRLDAARKKKGA